MPPQPEKRSTALIGAPSATTSGSMARAEKRLISPTAFAWLRRCATRAAGAVHAIEVHGHQILCPEGARRRPLLLAHSMMSLCFHTRPVANSPTGLGNSGWAWQANVVPHRSVKELWTGVGAG